MHTPTNETDARIAYIRFEYTRTTDTADPDIAPDVLDFLHELNDEHVHATGTDITPLAAQELDAWYDGLGAAVRDILGDYVTY